LLANKRAFIAQELAFRQRHRRDPVPFKAACHLARRESWLHFRTLGQIKSELL
jgi:hypothetical protein